MRIRKIEAKAENRKTKVAVYCRVSTMRTEQEDSLEVQKETYTRYIASNPDWDFAGLYSDQRSGLNAEKREGFMQMIADSMAGKIDMILCKSVSRFSRNIVECQRYTQQLRDKNITVVFEKEHIRTDVPISNLIFSLMCAIAQDESRSISENIKTANRHRVEQSIYTPRKNQMLGYDVEKGKLTPNKDAWIIRVIFEMYAFGQSIAEICRELNARGAVRHKTDKPFTHQVIQRILQNESYVGDKRLQKQPPRDFLTKKPEKGKPYATNYLQDDHKAIVSRKVWNTVQRRIANEKMLRETGARPKGISHELYGHVFCGCCGAPYVRRTQITRRLPTGPRYIKVWKCREKVKGGNGNGCKNPDIREERLAEEMRVFNGRAVVIDAVGRVKEKMARVE